MAEYLEIRSKSDQRLLSSIQNFRFIRHQNKVKLEREKHTTIATNKTNKNHECN